jgi:hypothetical protein
MRALAYLHLRRAAMRHVDCGSLPSKRREENNRDDKPACNTR